MASQPSVQPLEGRRTDRPPAVLGLLREPARPARRIAGYAVAILGTAALVGILLPFRNDIRPVGVGFGFLVLVLVATAVGRLGPGITASILGFLAFNFFFIPPYGTFAIERPENVVVLFVFLGVSVMVSFLLARATERAETAEAREAELRTLQELSRVLVAQGPGLETYRSLLQLIAVDFGFASAALFVKDPTHGLVEQVSVGATPGTLDPAWSPATEGRAPERLPLSVGGRTLGLIVLGGDRSGLTSAESRVLRALCDQLALVLERDRLLRAATEAEVYRQGEQMRRSLLAAVSHDLRSPLAAIKASVTDLLEPGVARDDEQRREVLETIDRETDRLNALIANLLDMSRIESGVLKPRIEIVNLAERIASNLDGIAARMPSVGVRMVIDPGATLVRADPTFLDRVLANLLDNGAKAAMRGDPPSVEVDVRPMVDRTTVRVIDHGEGVPAEAREQLFYPFYHLQDRDPRLGPGLGLGIAKGFLALMDGEIWVEETPGGGATMAFSLPRIAGRP